MIHSHCNSRGNANSFAKAPGSLSAPQIWEPQPQFLTVDLRARCAHKGIFFVIFCPKQSQSITFTTKAPPPDQLTLVRLAAIHPKAHPIFEQGLAKLLGHSPGTRTQGAGLQSTRQGFIAYFGPALEKRPTGKRACSNPIYNI